MMTSLRSFIARSKHVSVAVLVVTGASACTRATEGQVDDNASALTDINITLPAKSKLPGSLATAKLGYCFEAHMNAYDSKKTEGCLPIHDIYSIYKFGEYQENVTISAKLKRDRTYWASLVIGEMTASGAGLDPNKLYYMADQRVSTQDMAGKDKLSLVLKLELVAGIQGGESLPPEIETETGDIDLDVQVELPDSNQLPDDIGILSDSVKPDDTGSKIEPH